MATNHTFTRAVPRDPSEEMVQDKLFRVDRRDNALTINPRANNFVRTVTDEPLSNWEQVFASAATSVLSGVPGVPSVMLNGAYARGALRPSNRGLGRGRDR
jgi:hypothetical protein